MLNKRHQKRLLILGFYVMLLSLVLALVIYALRQNLNFFYTPEQVFAGAVPANLRFRVGGLVEIGSLIKTPDQIRFVISDGKASLETQYAGVLPDLFREGQGVVANGMLRQDKETFLFVADEILAKHDENYRPPELKQISLEEAK